MNTACMTQFMTQGNGRRHVPLPCQPIRDAFSQQAADAIDCTVRCDWLQVASFCTMLYTRSIMLMRSVQVLWKDFLQVLS